MNRLLGILVFFCLAGIATAQPAIGEWEDHNSFVAANRVEAAGERVYASTRMAMFYFDKKDSTTVVMTKVNGLTDVGISTFAYDENHDYNWYQTLCQNYKRLR